MDFPLKYIPDEKECYNFLLLLLHEDSMKFFCLPGNVLPNPVSSSIYGDRKYVTGNTLTHKAALAI
jgi:hypothetical protein